MAPSPGPGYPSSPAGLARPGLAHRTPLHPPQARRLLGRRGPLRRRRMMTRPLLPVLGVSLLPEPGPWGKRGCPPPLPGVHAAGAGGGLCRGRARASHSPGLASRRTGVGDGAAPGGLVVEEAAVRQPLRGLRL